MLNNTLQHERVSVEEALSELPDAPTADDLKPWRDRIDALDRAILALMNERVECAHVIGEIKKRIGLPVYVPSREEQVLRNVEEANEGPLTEAAVRRLFERVIDETRSLERQTYQGK